MPTPVTVTLPPAKADTDKLSPKFIVPAVPTALPLFSMITPEPEPTIPVKPLPSPTKVDAVILPEATTSWPEYVTTPLKLPLDGVQIRFPTFTVS